MNDKKEILDLLSNLSNVLSMAESKFYQEAGSKNPYASQGRTGNGWIYQNGVKDGVGAAENLVKSIRGAIIKAMEINDDIQEIPQDKWESFKSELEEKGFTQEEIVAIERGDSVRVARESGLTPHVGNYIQALGIADKLRGEKT